MKPVRAVQRRYRFVFCVAAFTLSVVSSRPAQAALDALLEDPAGGQVVADVGILLGWALSEVVGTRIGRVTLLIDGVETTTVPCCGERPDVADFPGHTSFPRENTLNSGYAITWNYKRLNAVGQHTIGVKITDTNGKEFTQIRTVTMVKPGGFEFLGRVDITTAIARLEGQDILLAGVRAVDAAFQQEGRIALHLRWLQSRQALGIVDSSVEQALQAATAIRADTATAQVALTPISSDASSLQAFLESPQPGDIGAGIDVIRGWAFSEKPNVRITKIVLSIEGLGEQTPPCCGERPDVADHFPQFPQENTFHSGFGAVFNDGRNHGLRNFTVKIEASDGQSSILMEGVLPKARKDLGCQSRLI